jgi:hypothetical protein
MAGKKSKPASKKKVTVTSTRDAMNEIATSAEVGEDLLLPDAGVVSVGSDGAPHAEEQALPKGVAAKPVEQKSPAEWAYERIILYIRNFEEQLDGEHEVAMGFAGGDVGSLRIEGMGFFAPDLITFYGSEPNGAKMQLVQHVSQLSVMLRALPKPKEQGKAVRIGFELSKGLEKPAQKPAKKPAKKTTRKPTRKTARKSAAKPAASRRRQT